MLAVKFLRACKQVNIRKCDSNGNGNDDGHDKMLYNSETNPHFRSSELRDYNRMKCTEIYNYKIPLLT